MQLSTIVNLFSTANLKVTRKQIWNVGVLTDLSDAIMFFFFHNGPSKYLKCWPNFRPKIFFIFSYCQSPISFACRPHTFNIIRCSVYIWPTGEKGREKGIWTIWREREREREGKRKREREREREEKGGERIV